MAATPDRELTLLEHLEELRSRLLVCVLTLVIAVVIGYFLAPWPLEWLTRPLIHANDALAAKATQNWIAVEVAVDGTLKLRGGPQAVRNLSDDTPGLEFYTPGGKEPVHKFYSKPPTPLLYLHPMDPFTIRMKASVVVGIILSLPVILWQLWGFISPGLLENERKLAVPMVLAGSVLFPLGATFAYWLLDVTIQFFQQYLIEHTIMFNDAQQYLSFALTMMLAFGAVFELPLGVVIATRLGIVSPSWLSSRRKYIFVVLLVISAIVTPTGDPLTLMAMTLPLHLLFEIALVASYMLDKLSPRESVSPKPEAPAV